MHVDIEGMGQNTKDEFYEKYYYPSITNNNVKSKGYLAMEKNCDFSRPLLNEILKVSDDIDPLLYGYYCIPDMALLEYDKNATIKYKPDTAMRCAMSEFEENYHENCGNLWKKLLSDLKQKFDKYGIGNKWNQSKNSYYISKISSTLIESTERFVPFLSIASNGHEVNSGSEINRVNALNAANSTDIIGELQGSRISNLDKLTKSDDLCSQKMLLVTYNVYYTEDMTRYGYQPSNSDIVVYDADTINKFFLRDKEDEGHSPHSRRYPIAIESDYIESERVSMNPLCVVCDMARFIKIILFNYAICGVLYNVLFCHGNDAYQSCLDMLHHIKMFSNMITKKHCIVKTNTTSGMSGSPLVLKKNTNQVFAMYYLARHFGVYVEYTNVFVPVDQAKFILKRTRSVAVTNN